MLPETSQRAIRAYSNGVNAWLNREGREFASRLPPEFVILGHEPATWEPAHTVAALKMMSVTLASNSTSEVQRLSFARLGLTPDEIDDLLPALSADNPPPLPDLTALLGLDTGPLSGAKSTESAQSDFIPMGHMKKWALRTIGFWQATERKAANRFWPMIRICLCPRHRFGI